MTKYEELCYAAAEGMKRKQEAASAAAELERQRQLEVATLFLDLCDHLKWPEEQTYYIDLESNQALSGPVTSTAPPLACHAEGKTGHVTRVAAAIGLKLEGVGGLSREVWLRFDFSPALDRVTFAKEDYALPAERQGLFDAVCTDIREALLTGEEVLPLRRHWAAP
jgi:hypothetical protein